MSPSLERLRSAFLISIMAAALAGFQGCGGRSGGGSAPAPTIPSWFSGVWTGTNTTNGEAVSMLALPSGAFRMLGGASLNQVVGTLGLDGTSLSGSGSSVAVGSGTVAPATFSGTATQSPARMNLNLSANNGTFAYRLSANANANVPVTLAQLAGTYTSAAAANSSGQVLQVTLQPDGTATLSSPALSGTETGTLAQVAPNLNAFTVSVPPSPGQPYSLAGLAFLLPAQGLTPATLVAICSSPDNSRSLQGTFTQQ